MSSGDEARPSSPSILGNVHRGKKRKCSSGEEVKIKVSKETQVTPEDIATASIYQRNIFDHDELRYDVSHLQPLNFEDEPKDPRNKAFARLVAHELDQVPIAKRSVTYTNIINLIRKARQQKDLDDISLPSYQDSE